MDPDGHCPACFALSSGTIGAALSSSLSKTRAIAISYATVHHPTPSVFFEPAHILGGQITNYLWHNWGEDKGGLRGSEVDLYSMNIPLVAGLLSDEGLKICWTKLWRNSYGRLFQTASMPELGDSKSTPNDSANSTSVKSFSSSSASDISKDLIFKWSPDMTGLIMPSSALPPGSDGWAIHKGWVSVTALRASFAEAAVNEIDDIEDKVWKMKL
jgi:5'/3'-nucleotidase SurE